MLSEAHGDTTAAADLVDLVGLGVIEAEAPALLLNGGGQMLALSIAEGRHDTVRRLTATLADLATRTESPVSRAMAQCA